jgi:hypothetical protein
MSAEIALRRVVARAETDPEVLAALLFGRHARGDAGPRSDVDVCLVLEEGVDAGLAASRRRLDSAGVGELGLNIFQQLPLYVRSRVLEEGRVAFVRDGDRLFLRRG